jgi:hypothetical protein
MRRILSAIWIALLCPALALGAVAYDSSNSATSGTGVTGVSLTINASGSNRLLVCAVHQNDGSNETVSSVTHNGVNLTHSAVGQITTGTDYAVDLWYLIAPATNNQTVTATLSGTAADKALTCVTFTGAHQTTPMGTCGTDSGIVDSGTPGSVTITIASGGMGIAVATNNDSAVSPGFTVDANSTKRIDIANANYAAIVSTSATSGTNAMTIAGVGAAYQSTIACPIAQAAAGAPAPAKRRAVVFQ